MVVVDRPIIRQSYENSMDRVSRLTMYALSSDLASIDEEVAERCRRLVLEDAVVGCLSLRRLMDATGLIPFCRHVWVPSAQINSDEQSERAVRSGAISAWQVFGVIVHARRLELIDNQFVLAIHSGKRASDILITRHKEATLPVDPLCFARSDHMEICFFIRDFVGCCHKLLESARDAALEKGVFLSDFLDS